MAITRINVETTMVARLGAWLTQADLDGTTVDGTNTDLVDPISTALTEMGYSPATYGAIVDADLSGIPVSDYNKLLDLVELRLLESIERNFDDVTMTMGPRREEFSKLLDQVQKARQAKQDWVDKKYKIGKSRANLRTIIAGDSSLTNNPDTEY